MQYKANHANNFFKRNVNDTTSIPNFSLRTLTTLKISNEIKITAKEKVLTYAFDFSLVWLLISVTKKYKIDVTKFLKIQKHFTCKMNKQNQE